MNTRRSTVQEGKLLSEKQQKHARMALGVATPENDSLVQRVEAADLSYSTATKILQRHRKVKSEAYARLFQGILHKEFPELYDAPKKTRA